MSELGNRCKFGLTRTCPSVTSQDMTREVTVGVWDITGEKTVGMHHSMAGKWPSSLSGESAVGWMSVCRHGTVRRLSPIRPSSPVMIQTTSPVLFICLKCILILLGFYIFLFSLNSFITDKITSDNTLKPQIQWCQ